VSQPLPLPKVESALLGKFVPLSQFRAEWVTFFGARHVRYHSLPTEFLIGWSAEPVTMNPRQARAFETGLHVYKGKIVTYEWLFHLYRDVLGAVFPGTLHAGDDLMLAEVWENCGDEGHTDYRLQGYRFVGQKELDAKTHYGTCLPELMHLQCEDCV